MNKLTEQLNSNKIRLVVKDKKVDLYQMKKKKILRQYRKRFLKINNLNRMILRIINIINKIQFMKQKPKLDTEQLGIPDADYSADIVINSNDFHHMLSQLNHFGSKLKFKLGYDDNIYIRTEGDLGKMQVRIKDEDIVEYVLEEEKMFEVDFGIRFLERFCGFSKVNHFVNLHISENIPMKMQYNLSNWKENTSEENYIDKNYIKIYLAPLVGDD